MNSEKMKNYTGCGVIIFRAQDNKVFIAQRKLTKSFGGGLWETIGGGIEKQDKNFLACVKREVNEELNTSIKTAKEFKDYVIKVDNEKTYLIKTFIVELESEPIPNKNDFEDHGWFTEEEIENLDFVSNCKERVREYFSTISREGSL